MITKRFTSFKTTQSLKNNHVKKDKFNLTNRNNDKTLFRELFFAFCFSYFSLFLIL